MTNTPDFHEHFEPSDEIKVGSEKTFGLVFAAVFALIGALPMLGGGDIRAWALIVAALFLIAAFAFPKLLRPLNLLWFRFGLLLHKIVNPLVMGMLFFLTVTPIALIMRLAGKDPLNKAFDKTADSYWVKRDPEEMQPDHMRRQF